MFKPLSAVLAACVFAGCAEQNEMAQWTSVGEIDSPAGEGSGEPFLSPSEDGVYMSWLEKVGEGSNALMVSHLGANGWSEASVVAQGDDFFVNWADFPSVTADSEGTLWAHWLQRGEAGGYDYGVRIATSTDRGATWSEPWTPHEDGTPTEHGFVSTVVMDGAVGFSWLDGRQTAKPVEEGQTRGAMTLRWRTVGTNGERGEETLLDARVCDCCQTSAALTPSGPVVAYRNRTEEEIRDIYITRNVQGEWVDGVAVHDDGWEIGGCPVNGPKVTMAGDQLAVTWFTGAGDVPKVKVAFSGDDGATFSDPYQVDSGNPAGRVDALGMPDGTVVVTWLERTGGENAEVRMRRYARTGPVGDVVTVTTSRAGRASGFPRMTKAPDGTLLVAWTDASATTPQVRVSKLALEK
jgi:hypothetical protein